MNDFVNIFLIEIRQSYFAYSWSHRGCIIAPFNIELISVGEAQGICKCGNGNLIGKIRELDISNLACTVMCSIYVNKTE